MPRHRRCLVLRGQRPETAAREAALTVALDDVLRVGPGCVPASRVRRLLGQAFDAVVVDLHDGVDADVLGQCHGLVRGGGAMILRMPPEGEVPPAPALAPFPYSGPDVGTRFWARLEACLQRSEAVQPPGPLSAPPKSTRGTGEQKRIVERVGASLADPTPSFTVLIADRGRGKSSALGLALRRVLSQHPVRAAVTAPQREAAAEVFRFASGVAGERLCFLEPSEIVRARPSFDVIVVDEAAQLPVPLLRALVVQHPGARVAFSTTTHGYEGTGRGFVLRFLDWLEREPRPLQRHSLRDPIRWDAGDPLEALVFDILALDAEATPIQGGWEAVPEPFVVDRDVLARDETMLRSLFGLLVHAHYRTVPGDLHRLLDAPNLAIHVIARERKVLAATLVAREGGLDHESCEAFSRGRGRIRGHALADTLMTHAARPEAGALTFVRSVRIATLPEHRRLGLAQRLVDHVHRSYCPDVFGTLFGATPDLLSFRRALGYQLARVGSSPGARTGEPSVVMLRASSPRGASLVASLRDDLARNLPLQLELLEAEGELGLDPRLAAALCEGLDAAVELEEDEVRRRVERYLNGPQTAQAAAYELDRFVSANRPALDALDSSERVLVEGRLVARRPWQRVAQQAGYPTVRAAMRALRPALGKVFSRSGASTSR